MSKGLGMTIIEAENGGLTLITTNPEQPNQLPRVWFFKTPEDLGIHVAGLATSLLTVKP